MEGKNTVVGKAGCKRVLYIQYIYIYSAITCTIVSLNLIHFSIVEFRLWSFGTLGTLDLFQTVKCDDCQNCGTVGKMLQSLEIQKFGEFWIFENASFQVFKTESFQVSKL